MSVTRFIVWLVGLVVAGGCAPVWAQERPALTPTRDAIVGYHLAPATGETIDVRVIFRSGGKALRLDLPDQSFMLAVPPTRSLVLVVPLQETALDLPWADGPQPLFLLDERMRFTRKSELTIAGQRCVQWDTVLDGAKSTVCVTKDGIILRSQSLDPMGRRNLVDAFIVRFENAAEADFVVPGGYDRLVASPGGGPAK